MAQNMPQSRPQSAPDIAVRDITQLLTFKPGPDRRPVQGWEIEFTTPSGTRGNVFIPTSQYTPDNVRAAIMAQAAAIESVHKIAT